jgi:tetratricopeptide (TPR) repeat protein
VLNLLSRLFQTIRSPRLLVLLGVSLGLLALTRENALIFILLIVPWLVVSNRRVPSRIVTGWIALLILGVSIPLASVGLRNYIVGGEFALTTSQFGTNFFIGNNANSKGFYLPLRSNRGNVKYERNDAVEMAESVVGRKLSPREVSEFWTAEAVDYIRTQPVDWLGLMARKALLVWNRVEASDSEDITAYGHFSWMLGALSRILHFGTMVPLAAAGIWLTRRRWRELGLLYVMMASYAASLTLFFLFARYRVPLIPFTLMFASAGAIELRRLAASKDRRSQLQTGLVIACAAVLANLPLTDTRSQLAATYKNFGTVMIDAEKFPEAVDYLGKSLRYRPDVTVTLRGMAESLADLGRLPESRRYFERILQLDPDHFVAHVGLGRLDLMQGRSEEGIRMLERATRLAPSDSQPYYFLGVHFAEAQDLQRASQWLRAAADRETDSDMARLSLAVVLYRIGDVSGAEAETSRILKRDPDNTGALTLLARITDWRARLGRARPDL